MQPAVAAARRLGGAIQIDLSDYPLVCKAALLSRKAIGLSRRGRQLAHYLDAVPPHERRLAIGSGAMVIDGWLCTDLAPTNRAVVYLDSTKRWPMPSASFRFSACEHMIEHVPYEAGIATLSEAHRVLQPNGVLRISTPNLDTFRNMPDSEDAGIKDYIRWSNRTFGSEAEREEETSPVHVLNRMMHSWGHQYLYDEDTLRRVLHRVGFREVVRCDPGVSRHAELNGVDRHADSIGAEANQIESLILEATA